MAVYVDKLFYTEQTRQWPYAQACHLTADTIEELHAFAFRIGMKRMWFQDHPRHPHYDLTKTRRKLAIRVGAKEIDAREAATIRINAIKPISTPSRILSSTSEGIHPPFQQTTKRRSRIE
jgi:hypothetical protein